MIKRVEPIYWYVGFKEKKLQLTLYGSEIQNSQISIKPYQGIKLVKVTKAESPNYLFVELSIEPNTKPGILQVRIAKNGKSENVAYELKKRSGYKTQGLSSADFIYLLMPDRFSNGNPSNDKFTDMADTQSDKSNPWLRHGGDIDGIINHLDYIQELGATALWLNPVLENNQPLTKEGNSMRSAYHGYGITDFYAIDKRLGGNDKYLDLVNKAHAKGIKVVQDAVYNHVGKNHWWIQDLPFKNWLNQWPEYTNTSYKDQPLIDPYASDYDKSRVQLGWFVPFLPDLNQKNPFLATELIQQALWNTETFRLDAWRIDTYFYNDLNFMNRCNSAILKEFPRIHIFGESWVNSVANQAYFMENNIQTSFKSNLPGNVDFQFCFSALAALNEKPGWNDGVQKLYQVLAQDYLYKNPNKLVTFLDNHDLDRYYSVIGEDFEKYKTGLIWLLTSRGIPQMYYGTEILMKNFKNPTDAEVRKDFPGGWQSDIENKFLPQGRNEKENMAFDFVKKLANYRKSSKALTEGQLKQFLPFDDGVYSYVRLFEKKGVLVISNTSGVEKTINLDRFKEVLNTKNTLRNVLDGTLIVSNSGLALKPKQSIVLEF
ncbi:MAG: glycoside hydrolase family 13 protein [Leadbetterella sp.]